MKGDALELSEWINRADEALRASGVESSRLEAQVIAAESLGIDRSSVLARTGEVGANADQMLARRLGGEPLAFILGYREFYGRRFTVNSSVLIPRHETETIIEAFESKFPPDAPMMTLDLGTGSGILAVTLKLERPRLQMFASDVSPEALEVATANAAALGAAVTFVQSDGFSSLDGLVFDAIVSNPPYVADSDELPKEVSEFEPPRALYSGPTGLEFYERMAAEAHTHLAAYGTLILELGFGQQNDVQEIFETQGWSHAGTFNDLAGIQRVAAFHPS